jgi:transcriptional regulator with XRE-family HTH domain
MPTLRKKPPAPPNVEPFGERLARLRHEAGYSQRQLAAQLGISQRMVAYYEKQTDRPPADLLPLLSEVLGLSTDQLLGVRASKPEKRSSNQRLWRRFKLIEKLPPAERRHLLGVIDAVLERHRLANRDNAA